MTENEFWDIISAAEDNSDDDTYQDEALTLLLGQLPPQEIADYMGYFNHFHALAERGDIWAAGMLLNGGHGSDDGFEYFRNWLISCGKETFFAALQAPDSLAEMEIYSDEEGRPDAEFEAFAYVPVAVYEDITAGKSLYEDYTKMDCQEPEKWNPSDYDNSAWLQQNLPNLWEQYGHIKLEFDQNIADESEEDSPSIETINIPDIGRISVGEEIFHQKLGQGIVHNIELPSAYDCVELTIHFGDEDHHMVLTPEEPQHHLFSLSPFV